MCDKELRSPFFKCPKISTEESEEATVSPSLVKTIDLSKENEEPLAEPPPLTLDADIDPKKLERHEATYLSDVTPLNASAAEENPLPPIVSPPPREIVRVDVRSVPPPQTDKMYNKEEIGEMDLLRPPYRLYKWENANSALAALQEEIVSAPLDFTCKNTTILEIGEELVNYYKSKIDEAYSVDMDTEKMEFYTRRLHEIESYCSSAEYEVQLRYTESEVNLLRSKIANDAYKNLKNEANSKYERKRACYYREMLISKGCDVRELNKFERNLRHEINLQYASQALDALNRADKLNFEDKP